MPHSIMIKKEPSETKWKVEQNILNLVVVNEIGNVLVQAGIGNLLSYCVYFVILGQSQKFDVSLFYESHELCAVEN